MTDHRYIPRREAIWLGLRITKRDYLEWREGLEEA